jgi:hypothetical protein
MYGRFWNFECFCGRTFSRKSHGRAAEISDLALWRTDQERGVAAAGSGQQEQR